MASQGMFGEAVDRIGGEPITSRMRRKAPIRHLDLPLILVTMMLASYGGAMIMSVTRNALEADGFDPNLFLKRQIAFFVGGAIILVAMSFFDYRRLRGLSFVLYGVAISGLVLVLTPLGDVQKGASRWINLGAFQVQPSEITKIAVIVTLAAYLAHRKGEVRALDVLVCLGLVALPSALIYMEPDLGTMMVLVALFGGLLLVGGAKVRHFIALAVASVIAVVVVLQMNILEPYQIERLTVFVDPNPDVRSEGYNLIQSKIAIGSGGLDGRGFEQERTQTSLEFVPEQHTDFIFTAVGEQLGFIGGSVLLGLFAFMIWRALRIAAIARDMFGTLIAGGIAMLWAVQLFVNVGMTMGIMPITGIPLPFISYGGSALMTNFIAVGLLLNIHMRRYV